MNATLVFLIVVLLACCVLPMMMMRRRRNNGHHSAGQAPTGTSDTYTDQTRQSGAPMP